MAPPPHAHPLPDPVDQEQFIPYWTTETGWRSELQLRNNLAVGDLTVTPALRLADGTETPLSPVTIKPQEIKIVDLDSAVIGSAPQYVGTYGSVVLRYHSSALANLFAMLMIHNIGHSIAFHIDATGEDQDPQSGSREGIWWLPNDTATDYLVLTNQSSAPLQLELSLFDSTGREAKQKIAVAARATNRLSARQLIISTGLSGTFGGIKVFAGAHAGSLDSVHLLFDEKASFSALLKMFDHNPSTTLEEHDFASTKIWTLRASMLALSHPDPALAFPEGTVLQPQFFVRNTLPKPADVNVRFNWRSNATTGKAAGPSFRLGPYETRRIDVAALQAANVLPKDANWASIILTTNGLPEEVMAVAVSYDETLRYGAQTPFSDQLAFHWVGSLWEYDAQHNSLITTGNGGTKPVQASFTIYYNQGTQKYEVEQTLQPDEQMWIDVGKLIREHVPDKNGNVLPASLTSGSYEIRDRTNIGIGTLFEGKITYDKTYGHVTYGCAHCCPMGNLQLWYDPVGVPLSSSVLNGVNATNLCTHYLEDVSGQFYNWSSGDSSMVAVASNGNHTGMQVGSTTSATFGPIVTGTGPKGCIITTLRPSDNVNVTPSVSVMLKFTGNKSGGDNLSFLKSGVECPGSDSLGAKDCTSSTGYWLWNLEGTGVVTDDASNWTIAVTNNYHYSGQYRDSNNNLQPFSCSQPNHPDGPQPDYLQQPSGQKTIFFIDGPGPFHGINPSNQCQIGSSPIDSMTDVLDFQVTFTSKVSSFVSTTKYFVKIVVAPGGKLDFTNTIAGPGNI